MIAKNKTNIRITESGERLWGLKDQNLGGRRSSLRCWRSAILGAKIFGGSFILLSALETADRQQRRLLLLPPRFQSFNPIV